MVSEILHYLREDIWRVRSRKLPRRKLWLFKSLRVVLLALRGFDENKCSLHASALTFYTMLSIVPVLAMAFGIAQGFGLKHNLEIVIAEKLRGQEQVVVWLIQFANTFLENTAGGVVAGVGVALLFWSVIKVLGNIESSFNEIWGVRAGRTLSRKFSDYLSIMLIAPVLLMVSSGATVFLATQLANFTAQHAFMRVFGGPVAVILTILPFMVLGSLFSFIYILMPNTRVSLRAGLTAGMVAGTIYQLVQWIYVYFQIGVSSFNAVYGGFAALPLFLTWLQISWLVVLFGAEVSFAVDNEEKYEFERDCTRASHYFKRVVALKLAELCVKRFDKGQGPAETVELAHELDAPIRLVRELLFDLEAAGILSQVQREDKAGDWHQPAQPPEKITISRVWSALDRLGQDHPAMVAEDLLDPVMKRAEALDRAVEKAPENVQVRDI